jgi:elongation factor Tu
VGVQHLVVFVNKIDVADPELVDLVVMETEELVRANGYIDAPVVKGSALGAVRAIDDGRTQDPYIDAIRGLVHALDVHVPDPIRDYDAPFLMPVQDICTIPGRGTVVTGRVDRGTLRVGAAVEIVGLAGRDEIVVTGIQSFHKDREEARAGDNVGLLLRGVRRDEVERGMVVTVPGSIEPHAKGEAELYVLSAKEGGRHTAFASGYRPQFFFGGTDVTGTLHIEGADGLVMPGARARVRFVLDRAVALDHGVRFALREGNKTIGAGLVVEVA